MNLRLLYPGTGHETLLWPGVSLVEKMLRPLVVYIFLLLAFRLTRKRELSQATLFDFLIILLISNVVQNAIIGQDNSIVGSFAGVITLLGLSALFDKLTAKSDATRKLLEGTPALIVRDGKILENALQKEGVEKVDLLTALRKQGIASLSEVRYAILELDGQISVIKDDPARPPEEDCIVQEILQQASDTQKQ
ncbi:MAG: DUF421 domain-containing protein [Armatimonas sp.]